MAMSLSWDPNPSTRARMDKALCARPSCLPLQGLLPVGAPAWNTLGSPHPTTNLQTQWAWGTAAQDHGERVRCAICPHCCRNPSPCNFNLDPVLGDVGWAGVENSKTDSAQPTQADSASSMETEPAQSHLDLLPSASASGLAQLWRGKQKPSGAQPGRGPRQRPSSLPEGHWEEEIYQPAASIRQDPRLGQAAYPISCA
ncbi:hypothetical protein J1605_019733 [Eschrichtius robustus]|uniref:Uncharacterized protein n=1 Tax=Eschrichtius robustus TaxID=9764 RepID=A0AB34HPP2_ESCRO|nr:hypothetical protein J1605_019733 [Eschrichtius robustus]